MRPSWATYYKHTDAVIVVVDSTDRARMNIAKVIHPLEATPDFFATSFKLMKECLTKSTIASVAKTDLLSQTVCPCVPAE